MVKLGLANSRLKDYVWTLLMTRELDPERLAGAISATFKRRSTDPPSGTPDALTAAFAANDARKPQWQAFTRNVEREAPTLDAVVAELETRLMLVVRRLSSR